MFGRQAAGSEDNPLSRVEESLVLQLVSLKFLENSILMFNLFFWGVTLWWQISWSCFFAKAPCKTTPKTRSHVTILGYWGLWILIPCWFGWCNKVGWFTVVISNPHILGIQTKPHWEQTTRGVWWRSWWEYGRGILRSSKQWHLGLYDCCCGVWIFLEFEHGSL